MAAAGAGTKVVKSSGEKEIFDPNIITTDCVEAGVEFWTAAEVAIEVSKDVYDGINSDEIQAKILKALYTRNPEVAERYKRFHSMYVRTSSNTIERFDRKLVVNSLVKETQLPKEVAHIIAKETEVELRRLNLDFTSGPLIREIVNVKLLEHGYEGARSDYTRLGMPVYDAAQLIESPGNIGRGPFGNPEAVHKRMANNIFREYALLKVLPIHLADAHMKGDLHIHGLEYFATRPYQALHDLRFTLEKGLNLADTGFGGSVAGPAKNAQAALNHAVRAMGAYATCFSSRQGYHSLNLWLAPYLEGLPAIDIRQLAQGFLFELSQTIPLCEPGDFQIDLEIETGIPEGWSDVPALLPGGIVKEGIHYGDFKEEALEFGRALTELIRAGDYVNRSFGSIKPIFKIRSWEEDNALLEDIHMSAVQGRDVAILNMSTSSLDPSTNAHFDGTLYPPQREENKLQSYHPLFALQKTTLNLPRAAYRSGGSEERFYEGLRELLNAVRETSSIKKDIIGKRLKLGSLAFLDQDHYFDLEENIDIIGFTGLNEAVKYLIGEELHQSRYARDFGMGIVERMYKTLAEWNLDGYGPFQLMGLDETNVSRRLALLDSGQFPEAINRETYSISFKASSKANAPPLEKALWNLPYKRLGLGWKEQIDGGSRDWKELMGISREFFNSKVGFWGFAL